MIYYSLGSSLKFELIKYFFCKYFFLDDPYVCGRATTLTGIVG